MAAPSGNARNSSLYEHPTSWVTLCSTPVRHQNIESMPARHRDGFAANGPEAPQLQLLSNDFFSAQRRKLGCAIDAAA
jgi:hypothetical protein